MSRQTTLPADVSKYSESPVFTDTSVPEKLTRVHKTKPGVWGKLVILSGALDFIVPGPPRLTETLSARSHGVIRPAEPHHVNITGPVTFKIEFYR